MKRIWNVRLNVDEWNSGIAGLDDDADRIKFLAGFNAGINGKETMPKGSAWEAGWRVGNSSHLEAIRFGQLQRERALKRDYGNATVMPRHESGNATAMPNDNLQSTIEESTIDKPQSKKEMVAPLPRSSSKRPVRDNPPSLDEIAEYIRKMGYALDPQKFYDANERGGWTYAKGKSLVMDWRAHVRTWETRHKDWIKPAASLDDMDHGDHVPTAEQIAVLFSP